ncbi:MAG: drug/metabolite transporter superfamily protein YnfA [Verrucomicrobiales bacterium]|jgi:drug/metabolite transporter superfamily protein YnfA
MSQCQSILQGALRFTIVSLIGYSLWAFLKLPEAPLYSAITVIFVALSGWLLRPLVGAGTKLGKFYGVFATAFIAYAVLWCVGWFGIKGNTGEIFGSALGLAACAWILLRFAGSESQTRQFLHCWAVLFLFHTLGYEAGDWGHYYAMSKDAIPPAVARLSWGLGHGIGFGAGLGYVLFHCRSSAA